ncbi:MAG: phosphatidylglycerophosphatase A [Burkholderiales bacterium]
MTAATGSIPQPSWRFVFGHPSHFLAFGFGVGLMPFAPGTFGTLLAFPIFWLLNPRLSPQEWVLALLALFWIGVWACGRTGRALGVHDHGGMVFDETVAFLAVLFLTPNTLLWQAFAFLLFRLFDILKPPPIRYLDRRVKGGLGVMVDDLVAGLFALLCLAAWKTVAT